MTVKKAPVEKRTILKKHKFRFIDKLGMELEGGWGEKPEWTVAGDSSVSCGGNHLGEIRTVPQDTMLGVFDELKKKYPDDTNESCGFHIHVSLSALHHAHLANEEFFKYFLLRMENVAEFLKVSKETADYNRLMPRLGGKNSYCSKQFSPLKQLKGAMDRRTMLNFCPHKEHGTIENRLFPMFIKLSNARMAVYEYADTIESFLSKHKDNFESSLSVELPEDETGIKLIKEEICV